MISSLEASDSEGQPWHGQISRDDGRAGSEAAAEGKVWQCKTPTNPALCSGTLIFSGQERNGNQVLHTPGKVTDQQPRTQNSTETFSSEHALKGGGH